MYLGIDISKNSLECHKLDDSRSESKQFKNDKSGIKSLVAWSGDCCKVVMEATGVYWQACAFAIHQAGIAVSVVNPARVKRFGQSKLIRGKTDTMDAKLIAEFAKTMETKLWQPPSEDYQSLQVLVRERESLVLHIAQLKNQKHAHEHRQHCPEIVYSLIKEQIEFLKLQIKTLEKEIQMLCNKLLQKAYQNLQSIPGIGPVTASVLLAETHGLEFFNDAKQLTAYAGIAPRPNQSGDFTGKSPISKIGNSRLRKAFYLAALQASRHSVFKVLYNRILKRSNSKKLALIAVARKLLVIAFTLVRSNQPFDSNYSLSSS